MTGARLRWGVLGAARIAVQAVVPAILATGDQVVALGCRDLERGRRTAAELGIPKVLDSYWGVLELGLDAIYVPLPNSLHRPWTARALGSGHHALCEKPLGVTAREAMELAVASDRHGRTVAEAVMYRYHPRWERVLELVRGGRVGELRHIAGGFAFPLRPPPDPRWEQQLGGGALYDVGSYLINAGRWLAGREPRAALATSNYRHGVDASTAALLDFGTDGPGPLTLALHCGFDSAESQWLRITGSTGSLVLPEPFTAWHGQSLPILVEEAGKSVRIDCPAADPYQLMVERFGQSAAARQPVLTSARDAAGTLAAIEACQRSLISRRWEGIIPPSPAA